MAKKSLLGSVWNGIVHAFEWLFAFIVFRILKGILLFLWKSSYSLLAMGYRALAGLLASSASASKEAVLGAAGAVERNTTAKPGFLPLTILKTFEGAPADFEKWLYGSKSTVGIILGARGSGKSALGVRMLENWASIGRKTCAMGFEGAGLPAWIRNVSKSDEAPNGSVLLVDEGGIEFSSRDSMSKPNKLLSDLLFISRHKDLSLVFITQNSANLEVNSIRQADYLLLKRPALLQKDFERGKIKEIYEAVASDFKGYGEDRSVTYVYSDRFRGFARSGLPSFWTEKASKAYRRATP